MSRVSKAKFGRLLDGSLIGELGEPSVNKATLAKENQIEPAQNEQLSSQYEASISWLRTHLIFYLGSR